MKGRHSLTVLMLFVGVTAMPPSLGNQTFHDAQRPSALPWLELMIATASCFVLAVGLGLWRWHVKARLKRRYHLRSMLFHMNVIRLLSLSPTWMYRFDWGAGAILVRFLDGLPINVQIIDEASLYFSDEAAVPGGHRRLRATPLRLLARQRAWCSTPQAKQLAALVARSLRESQYLLFRKDTGWGCRLPIDGWVFNTHVLTSPQKSLIERDIVQAVIPKIEQEPMFASVSVSPVLWPKPTSCDATIRDRLRQRYLDVAALDRSHLFDRPKRIMMRYEPALEPVRPEDVGAFERVDQGVILWGDAGVGKTTWCRHVARAWAGGDDQIPAWLRQHAYLLVIPMGVLRARAQSSEDAPEEQVIQRWLTHGLWEMCLGDEGHDEAYPPLREALLILDGYDELQSASAQSVIMRLIQALLMPEDPDSSPPIVLTARTQNHLVWHFEAFVQKATMLRVREVSDHQREAMIEGYWGPHQRAVGKDLARILRRHPMLEPMRYHSLHLEMLCCIYDDQVRRFSLPLLFDKPYLALASMYRAGMDALRRGRYHPLTQVLPVPDHHEMLKRLAYQSEKVISPGHVKRVFDDLGIGSKRSQTMALDDLSNWWGMLKPLTYRPDRLQCDWVFVHPSFHAYYKALAVCDQLLVASGLDRIRVIEGLVGQHELVLFLAGLLSAHRKTMSLMQHLVDAMADAADRACRGVEASHFWQMLGQVDPGQHERLPLPDLDTLKRLGGFVVASEVTANPLLCTWLLKQVPPEDQLAWLQQYDPYGLTSFHVAVIQGSVKGCEWVLEQLPKDADPRVMLRHPTRSGLAPLHIAVSRGDLRLCRWLLRQVFDPEDRLTLLQQVTPQGDAPLHVALQKGHGALYHLLLRHLSQQAMVATLLQPTSHGDTALHLAVSRRDVAACRCLLGLIRGNVQKLRLLRQVNHLGRTPLHQAVLKGDIELGLCLLEPLSVVANRLSLLAMRDHVGNTPWHVAILSGHLFLCQRLFEAADYHPSLCDQATKLGATPLHLATWRGHLSVCRWVCEQLPASQRKVLIQHPDLSGATPLHSAAHGGHVGICDWLLGQSPELIEQCTDDGRTPLHLAASGGHLLVCQCLLLYQPADKRQAFLKQETEQGWTAVHEAAERGQIAVVCWLLDQMPVDRRLAWALQPNHDGDDLMNLAARRGDLALCQALWGRFSGADRLALMQQADSGSLKALHLAAWRGHLAFCQWWLQHVSDDDRVNVMRLATDDGDTALHSSADEGHAAVCAYLLGELDDAGRVAMVQQSAHDGATALHLAAWQGHEEICWQLLEAIQSKEDHQRLACQETNAGHTPLYLAALRGHYDVCHCLLEHMSSQQSLLALRSVMEALPEEQTEPLLGLLTEAGRAAFNTLASSVSRDALAASCTLLGQRAMEGTGGDVVGLEESKGDGHEGRCDGGPGL